MATSKNFDIAGLLKKFTGETERNAALSAANTALLSGLGLTAEAIEGKTPDEIKGIVAAKLAPGADVAALKAAQDGLAAAKEEIKTHVAAHATLSATHLACLAAVGIKPDAVAGKSAKEIADLAGQRVAAKSAETLTLLGFSLPVKDEQGNDLPNGKEKPKEESTATGADRVKADIVQQFRDNPALRVKGGKQPVHNRN